MSTSADRHEDRKHRTDIVHPLSLDEVLTGLGDYAIITLDPDAVVRSWSAGAVAMFGYDEEEAIGKESRFVFTPEDRGEHEPEREIGIAAAEGRARDDRWHLRRDGTRFWASGVLRSVRDETGRVKGFVKIIEDRTAEKRVEESLRKSEEQFSRLFIGSPVATMVVLAATGRIILANEQFFRLTGYWRSDVMGKSEDELDLFDGSAPRGGDTVSRADGTAAVRHVTLRTREGAKIACLEASTTTTLHGDECVVVSLVTQPASG